MNNINNHTPAFPVMDEAPEHGQHYGLSVRDYFAAKAMQGLITTRHPHHSGEDGADVLSKDAYAIADAMLCARESQEIEELNSPPENYCKPSCPEVHREYESLKDREIGGAYTCRKCGFHMPF